MWIPYFRIKFWTWKGTREQLYGLLMGSKISLAQHLHTSSKPLKLRARGGAEYCRLGDLYAGRRCRTAATFCSHFRKRIFRMVGTFLRIVQLMLYLTEFLKIHICQFLLKLPQILLLHSRSCSNSSYFPRNNRQSVDYYIVKYISAQEISCLHVPIVEYIPLLTLYSTKYRGKKKQQVVWSFLPRTHLEKSVSHRGPVCTFSVFYVLLIMYFIWLIKH